MTKKELEKKTKKQLIKLLLRYDKLLMSIEEFGHTKFKI